MTEAPKPVTRQDVARYAQVSTAVVSYTVNGGPKRVAPETRARVLEAVRVLGYRPNAAARTLRRGSSEIIGLVVSDSRNPFFAELCHAVEEAAKEQGRAVLISNATDAETAQHIRSLSSRQVDGMVIATTLSPGDRALALALGIPVVLINQYGEVDELATFGVQFYEGARSAVEHLLGHGYRRIAFVGGDSRLDQRESGWIDALADAGLPIGPRYRVAFSREGGHAAGLQLVEALTGTGADSATKPDAVFVSSDQQSVGVLAALHAAGLNVPDDVALVSFDGSPEAEYSWPPLTTVSQPVQRMAADAVAQLLSGAPAPRFTRYPTSLVVRRSCGCDGAHLTP